MKVWVGQLAAAEQIGDAVPVANPGFDILFHHKIQFGDTG
jgi:hypothetical protein